MKKPPHTRPIVRRNDLTVEQAQRQGAGRVSAYLLGSQNTYRTEENVPKATHKPLTPQPMSTVTDELRNELRLAATSPDNDSINAAISPFALSDAQLGQMLSGLADVFVCPAIVSAIE